MSAFLFWFSCFLGLTFAAAASQEPQNQPRPVHVLLVIKAMALTVKVRLTQHTFVATQQQSLRLLHYMFFVTQRRTCVARLMVAVQSLPPVPNCQQGREGAPVKRATPATGLCAWVGHMTSMFYRDFISLIQMM